MPNGRWRPRPPGASTPWWWVAATARSARWPGSWPGTAVPLGVLPLGTLNHFAKDLGLPQDVDGAVRVIAAGQTRDVDVAEVNGRVFINNSSIGIYPYMVVDRDRRQSADGHGKWPAMALAFVRMLWRFPRRRLAVRTEGWETPHRTPCLFVGNNAYSVELLTLGQRAGSMAGELWLFVAKQRSPLALLWFAVRAGSAGSIRPGTSRRWRPARSRSAWGPAACRWPSTGR